MNCDEITAKAFLESHGLEVIPFCKAEVRAGKTPDFKVFNEDQFLFYCEVKSSNDYWLNQKIAASSELEIIGGERQDPIFNRLSKDIYDAARQFRAVNDSQEHANVLMLINQDALCSFEDLVSVLTGNFYDISGQIYPIYKKWSDGRINDSKRDIHLYIWLDSFSAKPIPRLLFMESNKSYHEMLRNAFKGLIK